MPNSRHQRNHRHKEEDTNNNNSQHAPVVCARETSVAAAAGPNAASSGSGGGGVSSSVHTGNHSHQNDNAGARPHQKCCTPGVCPAPDDTIDPDEPFDAVRILCNNESCGEGCWMHKDCFENFETSVLAYLRSCGRARSWSEKQRLQNLWTKKGYDLAFKACDCKCGRGHIRKDLDYFPKPFNENSKKQKKHKKKNDKPMPVVSTTHKANSHSNQTAGHPGGSGHGHSAGSAASTATTAATSHASGSHTRGHQFLNHAAAASGVGGGGGGGGGGRGGCERKGKKSSTMKSQDTHKMSDSNGNLQHHQQGTLVDNHTVPAAKTSITTNGLNVLTTNNHHHHHHHLFQAVTLPGAAGGPYNQHNHHPQLRLRTNSVSSTGSAGSHSSSGSGSGSIGIPSSAGSPSPISSSPVSGDMFFKSRKSSDASTGSNDSASSSSSSSSSGFRHRADLSAFAALPRNKQNPYHIRMEEDSGTSPYSFAASWSLAAARSHSLAEVAAESGAGTGSGGCCDLETRNFVLSNLLSKKTSSARCALCKSQLPVFDCFPLLDGTFFLSPQSYDETAIQVIWDGRLQFLNAACLSCLEGHNHVRCLSCKQLWDGCTLVVGSMYTYDIFAATPCCQKRLTCKCCLRAVVDITQGLEFYSQYSQMVICPYCKANDYHFIRSLAETFSTLSSSSSKDGGGGGAPRRPLEPICH